MTLPISDDALDPAADLGYDDQAPATPLAVIAKLMPEQMVMQRPEAPAFAQFSSYLLGGTEAPIQILTQAPKRKRALIQVLAGASANVNGYVVVGNQGQIYANKPGQVNSGGILTVGVQIEYTGSSPLYLAPDGTNSLTVTVLDERYQ